MGFDNKSSLWQAAAQRRHSHRRRTNALLGVASIDLSGPHEATPRVGAALGQRPGHYFCALTLSEDPTVGTASRTVQTESDDPSAGATPEDDDPPAEPCRHHGPRVPLIYAEVIPTKAEATEAVTRMLAHVRDDHGTCPHGAVFRVHSDRGQEFLTHELEKFCADRGIRRTTTAGYDPSANGAGEIAIGYLKRNARYLLAGAMLPASWWGVAVQAAASYSRCAAGLDEWPTVAFGARAMCVRDPTPRNAFLPRSLPGTAFGPSTRVPGGLVIYHDNRLKEVVNFQPSAVEAEDLRFIKMNIKNWETPVAPAAPPPTADWDACRAPLQQPGGSGGCEGELASSSGPYSSLRGDQLLPAAVRLEAPAEAPQREELPEDPRIRAEELEDLAPESDPLPADPDGALEQFRTLFP